MRHPGTTRLQRYALGEVDAEARLAVEEHLAECDDCARLVSAERSLDEWIVQTAPGALPRGAARATFDRLWAEVDAQPDGAQPAAASPRAAPHWWLRQLPRAAAAAALLLMALELWQVYSDAEAGTTGAEDVVATDEDPTPADLGDDRAAPPGLRLLVAGEELDLERLAEVRAEVAAALLLLDESAPQDDAAFLDGALVAFDPMAEEGWSVGQLVRGHALGGAPALRSAALRYAVLDPESTTTLAIALDRPDLVQPVLELLASRPVPLAESPRLAGVLARVAGLRPDQPLSAEARAAVAVLARDGGQAELAELLRAAVDRAATRPPADVAIGRAYELLAHADVDARVRGLLRLGDAPAHGLRARGEFLALADAEPQRTSDVLVRVTAEPRRPAVLLDWVLAARLHELAEPLARDLATGSADESLPALLAELGDARSVEPLFDAWRAQGARPGAGPIAAALGSILARDAAATDALGSIVADDAVHDLVRLAQDQSAEIAGALLIVCLQRRPRGRDTDDLQAYLISSIARLGTERDGRALLAWIEAKQQTDSRNGQMPLAWAAAALLTQEASLAAWQRAGHDPAVLADVSGSAGPWPAAAERPPTRLLRSLDRSLMRPPAGADATNPPPDKETR